MLEDNCIKSCPPFTVFGLNFGLIPSWFISSEFVMSTNIQGVFLKVLLAILWWMPFIFHSYNISSLLELLSFLYVILSWNADTVLCLCPLQINRNRDWKLSWYCAFSLYNMARLWCTRESNSISQFPDGGAREWCFGPECWSTCSSLFSRHWTFRDILLGGFMSCVGVYHYILTL